MEYSHFDLTRVGLIENHIIDSISQETIQEIVEIISKKGIHREKIVDALKYNVITVYTLSQLTQISKSTIEAKLRPRIIKGIPVVYLNRTYPFKTFRESGPRFIVVDELCLNFIKKALSKLL